MKVKNSKPKEATLDKAMKKVDRRIIINALITYANACQSQRIANAIPVARAKDFFTNLRRIWGDWDKKRRRILVIIGNYFEKEYEKNINYLRKKLLQWKDNARLITIKIARNKIAKYIKNKYKNAIARNNWKNLVNKYDMFVNNVLLFQIKTRLISWLRLRDMAMKLRIIFKKVGNDQFKEGIAFLLKLFLMKSVLTNYEERNRFFIKRFIIRKWYMKIKSVRQREYILDQAMSQIDK